MVVFEEEEKEEARWWFVRRRRRRRRRGGGLRGEGEVVVCRRLFGLNYTKFITEL